MKSKEEFEQVIEQEPSKRFLRIELVTWHSYANLAAIPLIHFTLQTLQSDLLSISFLVLQDKNYFNVPSNEIGQVQSDLLFYPMPI